MHPRRRALLELLRDDHPEVRGRAAEALDRLDVLERLPEAVRSLGGLDREGWVRLLRSLVEVRDETGLRIALRALEHREAGVRVAALEVIEAFADWRATPRVMERLGDPDPVVRARAAAALGALGDRRASDPLVRLLDDGSPEVVTEAARALGRLGHVPAEPDLLRAAGLGDPEVRAAAAEALGRLGLRPTAGGARGDGSRGPGDPPT